MQITPIDTAIPLPRVPLCLLPGSIRILVLRRKWLLKVKLTTRLPSIADDNEAQSTLALRHYILMARCLIKYQNKWMSIFAFCNSLHYVNITNNLNG